MRKQVKGMTVLTMMLAVLILSATSVFAATASTDWDGGTITVEGYGAVPTTAHTAAQSRMMTRRAAVVDAYRALAEAVQGVQVDAVSTVKDMELLSDVTKVRVSALVKGAKIISEKEASDGSFTVVMSIPMYGVSNSLASAVLPETGTQEAFPAPVAGVAPSTVTLPSPSSGSSAASVPSSASGMQAVGGYTGLIVDCSGLGLKPVMSPVIRNGSGDPIYGYKNLDYKKVVASWMAGYTRDLHNAARAGSNPLIVRAISVDNHSGDPVLSVADANRVLVENAASGFLDRCAVVFVR